MTNTLDTLSERDYAILREQVSAKIEQLLPYTALPAWRGAFETQVTELRTKANGCPSTSEARSDYLDWSLAHAFILKENA